MASPKSFTGRKRRLTNRWSVWLTDRISHAVITVGGVATIAAVLMVFFFLLYVALPLFLPATIAHARLVTRESSQVPLLVGMDENGIYTWNLFASGKLQLERTDTAEIISEQQLLATDKQIHTLAWTPESDENLQFHFAAGLSDGAVSLGKLIEAAKFRTLAELPAEMHNLAPGEQRLFEGGILEFTIQGMYRWKSLVAELSPPQELSKQPLLDLDYLPQEKDSRLAAIGSQGELLVAEVSTSEDILTGETETKFERREIKLPQEYATTPWKVRILGRGSQLAVFWKNGRYLRIDEAWSAQPKFAESWNVCEDAELSALLLLQGRSTLVVGDTQGRLSAWFLARDEREPNAEAKLLKAHTLPAMSGAVTALARSTNLRMIVAGSAQGELATYHITTARRLTASIATAGTAIDRVAIAPNDDALLAIAGQKLWRASFEPRHPEATFAALFAPVHYESYAGPRHTWQSTAGTNEPEPKFGMVPLLFGTLKATFYSLLFAVPIALLAAIYTSEFVEPQHRAKIKSVIELMATIPSVVLGYFAGLVLAPFADLILPGLLASFMLVPLSFLCGAQLWQLLPHKLTLRIGRWRLLFLGLALLLGMAVSYRTGPVLETFLFAGDIKSWLNGERGSGIGGWFLLLLPICSGGMAVALSTYLNPALRVKFGYLRRESFALLNFCKFMVAVFATALIAYLLAFLLTQSGIDVRGGVFDSYVQRNSLVVGFVMGFAIIPIIFTISEDALAAVPQHLRSASLGCGATPWQTTWRVVIPTAASGLFSAVMVGFGRAIGETMIMLMATGNVPIMEINIFSGFRSLSANIAEELPEAAQWGTHFRLLFFTGLILLVFTFMVNTLAEAVRISARRRARQL